MSIERFDQIVTALSNSQCDIIIGSDQNIDYKNVSTNMNASNLLDIFFANNKTSHTDYSYQCYDN